MVLFDYGCSDVTLTIAWCFFLRIRLCIKNFPFAYWLKERFRPWFHFYFCSLELLNTKKSAKNEPVDLPNIGTLEPALICTNVNTREYEQLRPTAQNSESPRHANHYRNRVPLKQKHNTRCCATVTIIQYSDLFVCCGRLARYDHFHT